MNICIDLPWPDKALSQNARVHWSVKARATKKHRDWARWAATPHAPLDATSVAVSVTFSPPGNYRYDEDNLVARCKAYLDGIADGLRVNDRIFKLQAPRRAPKVKHGNVRFELTVLATEDSAWEALGDVVDRVVAAIPVPVRGAA